jgi:hypothetical protein
MKGVCKIICANYGTTLDEVFSDSHYMAPSMARKVIYKVMRLYGLSMGQIAKETGRSTSTIALGLAKLDESLLDSEYAIRLYCETRDADILHPLWAYNYKLAFKDVADEIKKKLNQGLSVKQVAEDLEVSEAYVAKCKHTFDESPKKKVPDYKNNVIKEIYA